MLAFYKDRLIVTIDRVNTLLRLSLIPLMSTFLLMTLYISFRQHVGNDEWTIGDWLINYEGGFVRRGLFGQFIFEASNILNVAPSLLVMIGHWLFYGVFFFYSTKLLMRETSLLPSLLLIISPFIFTYQIHATAGGFRKEIMYLAALAYLSNKVSALASASRKPNIPFLVIFMLYPLMILSHEMLAFFLPYLFALYFICYGQDKQQIVRGMVLVAPSVVAFLLAFLFQGDADTVKHIRASLGNDAPEGGALEWMAYNSEFGYQQVLISISEHNYIPRHLWYFFLACIAFVPFRHRLKNITAYPLSSLMIGTSLLGTVALSVIAIDWGRFMYLNFVSIYLVALAIKPPQTAPHPSAISQLLHKPAPIMWIGLGLILIFIAIYAVAWYIPHCCNFSPFLSDFTRKLISPLGLIDAG